MDPQEAVNTALSVVAGDRQEKYGPPKENHDCTARMWSAYMTRVKGRETFFTAEDVCLLNILQKISRVANDPESVSDNEVDIIGYTLNKIIVSNERKARTP